MCSKTDVLIFGAGSHAKVVLDILERGEEFRVVGLVSDRKTEESVFGYPVFSSMTELLRRGVVAGIVAIGDNWRRLQVVQRILRERSDFIFVSAIHPSAQIGRSVEIGAGTAVMAGVSINVSSRIARHCIVNTSASIDHDCLLGDFVSIGPGAVLGGNVQIGPHSVIALGAHVSNDLEIGANTVVGVGSAVTRDLPSRVVAYGVPCRVVRSREEDEPYLIARK